MQRQSECVFVLADVTKSERGASERQRRGESQLDCLTLVLTDL